MRQGLLRLVGTTWSASGKTQLACRIILPPGQSTHTPSNTNFDFSTAHAPSIVQSIGEIIKRLRTEIGLTFVIVEQNLDLINAVADRCIVIDKGSIIARLDAGEMADPAIARKYLAI